MSVYYVFPKRGFVAPYPNGSSAPGGVLPQNEAVTWALDVTVSEAPEYTGQLTESVVETGSVINDHLTQRPLRLRVEGIISDTPLNPLPLATYLSASLGTAPAGNGTILRSKAAYLYLKWLYQTRQLFDFAGGFETFQNMMVTEFRPTRTSDTGSALVFSVTLEQVQFVASQSLFTPTQKLLQKPTSHGQQPLQPVQTSQAPYVSDVVNQGSPVGTEETAHTLTPTGSLNLTGVPSINNLPGVVQ